MKSNRIRPIAIGIVLHEGRIFVAAGVDHAKGQTFYRPLGGGIEFGETGMDTVKRELREEIGSEVVSLRYIGTLENIFTYEGDACHEIVLVYSGDFIDQALYNCDAVDAQEDDGTPFHALWKRLNSFGSDAPLYPDGLLELLTRHYMLG